MGRRETWWDRDGGAVLRGPEGRCSLACHGERSAVSLQVQELLADPPRSCALALLPCHAPSSGRRISHDRSVPSLLPPASTEPPGSGCAL